MKKKPITLFEVEVKYSRLAIPDKHYFTIEALANKFKKMKKENSMVRWVTVKEKLFNIEEAI